MVTQMSKEQIVAARKLGFSKLMDMNSERLQKKLTGGWLVGWMLSVRKCIFVKEKIVILHFKSY